MDTLPVRKPNRLAGYDYSRKGAYFITICVKDRAELLCEITPTVGDAAHGVPFPPSGVPPSTAHGVPRVRLTPYGEIVKRRIDNVSTANPDVFVDRYVIMPNHIHLILVVAKDANADDGTPNVDDGTPRAASPTKAVVAKTINALKGLASKEAGFPIWQRSYHDHIIRDGRDHARIAEYIENNPHNWRDDCFYAEGGA